MYHFTKIVIDEEKKKNFYDFITHGFKVIKLDENNTLDISIFKDEIKILFISEFMRQPIVTTILSNTNRNEQTEIINYNLTSFKLNDNLVAQGFPNSLIDLVSFKLSAYECTFQLAKIFQSKSEYLSRLKMEDLNIKIDRQEKIKILAEKRKMEWGEDPEVIKGVVPSQLLKDIKIEMKREGYKTGYFEFINCNKVLSYYKFINRDNRFEVYYSIDNGQSFPYKRITQSMFMNMIEYNKLKKTLYR